MKGKPLFLLILALVLPLCLTAPAAAGILPPFPPDPEPTATVTVSPNPPVKGGTVTAKAEVNNYEGTYALRYTFQWTGAATGSMEQTTDSPEHSVPVIAGGYGTAGSVKVIVKDVFGKFIAQTAVQTFWAYDPLGGTVKLDNPATVAAGGKQRASFTRTGGTGDYTDYTLKYFVEEVGVRRQVFEKTLDGTDPGPSLEFDVLFGEKGIVTCQYRDRGFGEDYVYPEASFAITGSSPPLSGVGLTLAPGPTAVTSDTLTASLQFTGGKAPYSAEFTWDAENYFSGSSSKVDLVSGDRSPLKSSCQPKEEDYEGSVSVTLTDAVGRSVSKGPVTVRLSEPLSAKLVLSEEAPTVGESVTLYVNPSGGKPPLRCEAEISVEGQPPLRPPVGSYNDFEFTPAAAGKARATVTVTDAEGRSLVATKDFTVVPPLDATLELSPDPERACLGEPISVAVKATGGQGPYKYTYEWRSHSGTTLVQGPTTTNLASDSCTYADGTDGYVDVRIEDATGRLKEFTAKFAIDQFRLSVTLAPPEVVDLGSTLTVTAEAGGGKGKAPYGYRFDLRFLDADGKLLATRDTLFPLPETTFSVRADWGHTCRVIVSAKDALDQLVWRDFYVSVRRPGDANADGGVDLADLAAIVDAVAAGKPCRSVLNADLDTNGKVEKADALQLIQMLVD